MEDKYKITKNSFNKLAQKYEDRFLNADLYNESFDTFYSYIEKQNAKIFDIACGPGNISRYLLKHNPDFKMIGVDIAPNMIELAKKNNPKAEFHVMDCRDILQINKVFDAAICGFGLPYISKEEASQMITDLSQLIVKDGYLYLSTMEDDYEKSDFKKSSTSEDMAYVYYHSFDYLENALIDNGFSIVEVFRKDYLEHYGSITIDLFIIAKKI